MWTCNKTQVQWYGRKGDKCCNLNIDEESDLWWVFHVRGHELQYKCSHWVLIVRANKRAEHLLRTNERPGGVIEWTWLLSCCYWHRAMHLVRFRLWGSCSNVWKSFHINMRVGGPRTAALILIQNKFTFIMTDPSNNSCASVLGLYHLPSRSNWH